MVIPNNDLARQYKRVKAKVDAAVITTLSSGWYVLGKQGETFEREFAAYCNASHAAGVNSGTDALMLALMAAGVKPGEEVITVPNTAVPTATAISAAGCIPCFVDIDERFLTMSTAALLSFLKTGAKRSGNTVINKTTGRIIRAIIPVHLYGQCADMPAIMRIAREFHLAVIEDCAQSHGAMIAGKKCGTFGDAAAFSFYPTKNLGCYGDGGMVVTNNPAIDQSIRMLRNYGQADRYVHMTKGINSRLDEVQAAVLSVKLKVLDKDNAARRALAARYRTLLSPVPVLLPRERPGGYHVYHLFVVRVPNRDRLKQYLFDNGVIANIHYPIPIHLQGSYAELGLAAGSFPHAEKAAREIISLPFFPGMTDKEVRRVVSVIKQFYKQ